MHIENSYKYELDGVVYVSGNVPEGATILETMDILYAEDGYDLERIADSENVGSNIWLRDGDVQENYREVPAQEKIEEE